MCNQIVTSLLSSSSHKGEGGKGYFLLFSKGSGAFFRLQAYKIAGISQGTVGKSVI